MAEDGQAARAVKKLGRGCGRGDFTPGHSRSASLAKSNCRNCKSAAGCWWKRSKAGRARAGLQHGDVLLAIGNIPIRSLNQFNEILKQVPKGKNVALLVRRDDAASYVAIRLDEK